jgi:membrane-associated phospholipid phosphatase
MDAGLTDHYSDDDSFSAGAIIRWEFLDLAFLAYIAVLVVLLLIFGVLLGRHPDPWPAIVLHLGYGAAGIGARSLPRIWDNAITRFTRWWYPPILFLFCFEALASIIHIIRPEYIDTFLIAADQAIFGGPVTVWLQQKAQPWLTEIMYFCYTSYYFFIPGIGIPLYLRSIKDRTSPEGDQVREFIALISVSMLFCYIHFLFTPGAGPVFWADYPGPVYTLTGGPITLFEQWIFKVGAVVGGAFPSSHVVVAVVAAFYAVRFRVAPLFWAPLTIGLLISTMYNGYHYGVDVLYGIIVAAVMVSVVPPLFRRYESRLT